ncbi:hypothetical protein WJU23_10140 [Prosthecobacter sp. SYSU 5D2]|uniref:hypothetical protein n=1 Tax=Prosthecobacter sp. SYSU 5D2 TaxID=3134134 RepID=UPI0031FE8048
MRRFLPWLMMLVCGHVNCAEEVALRAQPWFSPCEILCANLKKAIEERPDLMVMRLEDALVINEPCAGDIVTAAIDAVRAKPHMVQQIIETAMKVAPARSSTVMAAVHSYKPGKVKELVMEEVRRAEIPATAPLMEIRRAEMAYSVQQEPIEEVRRAEMPVARAGQMDEDSMTEIHNSLPREEIRRAVFTVMTLPPDRR